MPLSEVVKADWKEGLAQRIADIKTQKDASTASSCEAMKEALEKKAAEFLVREEKNRATSEQT